MKTKVGFNLAHYMKDIDCSLVLQDGTTISFDEISYSKSCEYALETMSHSFLASTITELTDIKSGLARLRVKYHISFVGHPCEKPHSFERIVPVIKRY